MNDLQFLIVLAIGIAIGSYLPKLARRLSLIIYRYRYRPRLVHRHRLHLTQQQEPSNDV